MKNLELFHQWRPERHEHELYLFAELGDRRVSFSLVPHEFTPGIQHDAPPLFAGQEHELRAFLQQMVNVAASLGIMPHDLATTMAAQGRHLEDMRAIVFKTLDVAPPAERRR